MKELKIKLVIYCVLAIVVAFVALETADCRDAMDILYDSGNSTPGQHARFYFLTLMGIGVVIVQNIFISWSLYALERDARQAESQSPAPKA